METAWVDRLKALPPVTEAAALYLGRGASLGRRAAVDLAAPLYIISAGLGLVKATTRVPTYGITVSGRGEEAIAARVLGRFDPAAWWQAVSNGPSSVRFGDVLDASGDGIVLIALTAPYAGMVGTALSRLPDDHLARLRIFGWRLGQVLPSKLHASIMDYDDRLEATLPGTRTDFAQRALSHFAARIAPLGSQDRRGHRGEVERALSGLTAPARAKRPRASDSDILAWLGQAFSDGGGIGRLLKRIRQEGVACEQARFTRLYRQALQSKEAT